MANEWVKVELYGANNDGSPRRYTIADGTAVSQGQLLQLNDARTVIVATGATQAIAGVASEDHNPNEGVTSISVWTDGVFLANSSGAITAGAGFLAGGNNQVVSGAITVYGYGGYVLNTTTNGQTSQVRLQL